MKIKENRIFIPKNLKVNPDFTYRDREFFRHTERGLFQRISYRLPSRELIDIFEDSIGIYSISCGWLNIEQYREVDALKASEAE